MTSCKTSPALEKDPLLARERNQRTLVRPVSFSGIGIHTGKMVSMRFLPAAEHTGIKFKRTDLPSLPEIPATVEYVVDTSRSTILGLADVRVHTVEHVLAALRAFEIDNLCIEIDNLEPPVGNGSSDVFVEMIEEGAILEQKASLPIASLAEPVYYSEKDIHIVALPSPEYRISYTLSYPEHPLLKAQFHSLALTPESFKKEIAPCRTFSLYKEISYLIDKGLIKGGSLDNAVVIHDEAAFSKGGLFFPDEMVRHKILDLIGDLSLVGFPFLAHIIAIRSGHTSNWQFSKQILKSFSKERC
jgi:UDP-3-O-[3-hydroxymyristoyl] N-acetylglucosamine deacetylase